MSDYVKDAVKRGIKFADDSGEGVWRTVNGRAIFIKEGEDLDSAIKRQDAGEEALGVKKKKGETKGPFGSKVSWEEAVRRGIAKGNRKFTPEEKWKGR